MENSGVIVTVTFVLDCLLHDFKHRQGAGNGAFAMLFAQREALIAHLAAKWGYPS
jgi:hypothetical protein